MVDIHIVSQVGQLVVVLGIAWKANRVLNRLWDVLLEFPPHRHIGDDIVYPKGFEPGKVEK